MKTRLLIVSALVCGQLSAQTAVPAIDLDEDLTLSVEVAPIFFFANGFRAGSSLGYKQWEFGLISYSHEVFDDVQEIAFDQSQGFDVERNIAIQAHATWFTGKRRRNFFVGGGIAPEWYSLTDTVSTISRRASTTYAFLRTGATVYPFQPYVFLSFQLHVKYAFAGTAAQNFEGASYQVAKLTGIPHWSLGVRFPFPSTATKSSDDKR